MNKPKVMHKIPRQLYTIVEICGRSLSFKIAIIVILWLSCVGMPRLIVICGWANYRHRVHRLLWGGVGLVKSSLEDKH